MPKIVDTICYNGEKDLFDLRYNILKDVVDEFIVVEFDKTFSGKDKEWLFPPQNDKKIKYFMQSEKDWLKYKELAESSPNTVGAEHWKREFMQKESIKDCLTHLKDDDIVFIGDCDEIWNPFVLLKYHAPVLPIKLRLEVYTYYLNNLSSENFWGTLQAKYGSIKDKCLNHLRTNSDKGVVIEGWHFTSMKDSLKQKLEDSYTDEDYATEYILENLNDMIRENKDFLGRNFTYKLDEREWPQYLKENKEKYRHLLK